MSAEEGHQLRSTATLIDGNDGESATTTCFPVDRNILGVGLWRYKLSCSEVACDAALTLIKLVSHAFLEMRRLS